MATLKPRGSTSSSTVPLMPGDIKTEPHAKLVFNAPFSEKNRYHVTIANLGAHRIGWKAKTTDGKRLVVAPPAGVLDPKEQQLLFVIQEAFSYEKEDTNNNRITFEWTTARFQGDGRSRWKDIPIQYNR